MATERQVSIVETRSVTSNFVDSTQEAKALDAAITGVAESSKQLTQAEINLQGQLDRMDAKYNEATRSANELARAQDLISRARKQGIGNEEQYARILAGVMERQVGAAQRATGAMQQLGRAANDNSKNFGLASHQIQNLGFQLNDLIVQIGSGGGIFRPLLQQGAQVQQILSMSEGGVAGVLGRVADKMKAIGPAALIGWGAAGTAVTAVVAATGLAIKATIDYQNEMAKTNRILSKGPGLASGIKAGDVQEAGKQAAAQGGIALPDARNVALEFAKLGKVGADVMKDLTKLAEPFARTLGIEMPQAVKELSDAFSDPAEGIAVLANRLGILDGAQVQHIQTIARTQGAYAAQVEMIKAVRSGVIQFGDDMVTVTSISKKFSDDVTSDFDKLMKKIAGGLGFGPAIDRELKVLEQKVQNLKALQAEIDAGGGTGRRAEKVAGPTMSDDFSSAFAEGERLRREQEENASRSAQAAFDKISRAAFETAKSLDPIGQKFDDLAAKAQKLQAGLAIPDQGADLSLLKDALDRVTDSMYGATSAAEMRNAATAKQTEANQLALASLQALTLEERAGVAAAQARNAILATGTNQTERDNAARQASLQVITASNVAANQAIAIGQQQAAMQQAELAVQLAGNDVERQAAVLRKAKLTEEQTLLNLLNQGVAPQKAVVMAKQQYLAVLAQESAARAQANAQADKAIAQGRLEIQALGAVTVAEKALMAARQMALQLEDSLMDEEKKHTLIRQAHQKVIAQSEASLKAMIQTQEAELRLTNAQIGAVGMEEKARASLLAGIRAENELKAQGIDINSKLAQQYIANAKALATATEKLREAEEAQKRLDNATKNLAHSWAGLKPAIDAAGNAMAQYARNTASATSAMGQAATAATKVTRSIIPAENTMAQIIPQGMASFYHPGVLTPQFAREVFEDAIARNVQRGMPADLAELQARQDLQDMPGGVANTPYREFIGTNAPGALAAAKAEWEKSKTATTDTDDFSSDFDDFSSSMDTASSSVDSFSESLDSIGRPIQDSIDSLRGLQEAALSRIYRPDPYAEKNPDYFYNGEQIMKAGQDRIFDGLQVQIEKLQGLQVMLGTLVNQSAMLPQTLVDALVAAGFSNIAEKIVSAFMSTSPLSSTPNQTAVQGSNFGIPDSFWNGVQKWEPFNAKTYRG